MADRNLNEAGETWDDDYGLDPKATTTNPPTERLTAAALAEIRERAEKATE